MDKFEKVRGMSDPGGVAVDMLNDPKISSIQKEQIRNSFMKDYNIDTLPIPGDFINHSELGNVKVLKIIDVDIYGGPAEYEIENSNGKSFPITFDELTDMIGYGDISDVPQPLKNSFDFQLVNQEICEAKLFRSTRSFNTLDGKDVADILYLNTMVLYMLSKIDSTKDYAIRYAKNTISFGTYSLFRTFATDLYMLAYQVKFPENDNARLKDPIASKRFLNSCSFQDRKHIEFLRALVAERAGPSYAQTYFYRLETQLKVSDSRYKRWRREISRWQNVRFEQQKQIINQIKVELRRMGSGGGRGNELLVALEPLSRLRGYGPAAKLAPKKTGTPSMAKRIAGTAVGAAAGRYAADKINKASNKTAKNVGTGMGAIAGYWASGRRKQS